MSIKNLQKRLQSIYEIDTGYAVSDFLISDESTRRMLDRRSSRLKETVFVSEAGDGLDISVYIDAGVLENLQREDPEQKLHSGNIEDFCLATEGISHFLKLVWHGEHEREVSLLELELQAEVDKFILMYLFLSEQHTSVNTRQLRRLIFDAVRFHPAPGSVEHERYNDANFYAGKYCQALEQIYIHTDDARHMLKELRRFYRLPLSEKLRRINKLN
ncbi:MAG: hypothetical protein MI673_03340 [Thiotrichales bacterium]|nr:hypothetical protein [Thiotrichales bacterium]